MKRFIRYVLVGVGLSACGGNNEDDLLVEYRAVLPELSLLQAKSPTATGAQNFVSRAAVTPAVYPLESANVIAGVNGAVEIIISVLHQIVDQPPSLYNSEKKEFIWGPIDNKDGHGLMGAFIRDKGEDAINP